MNPVGVFTPHSAVFPDSPSDFEAFRSVLSRLSLSDTLFWAGRLNLIISNPLNTDHKAKQQYGLNVFFTPKEIGKINNFADEHGKADNVTIFFRGQLLELIRWASLFCQNHPNDGTTFDDPTLRRAFAEAVLIAGDLWGKRVYGNRFSLEGGVEVARLRGLGAIRGALAETTAGIDPLLALGRGKTIFADYFPKCYPEFEVEFHSRTGLSTEDYYLCLCLMATNYLNCTPEQASRDVKRSGLFDVNTFCEKALPNVTALFSRYIPLESQTPDELRESLWSQKEREAVDETTPFNFKPLRQRPILRVPDGRAIILDPVFYSERATVGPLFLITEGVPNKKANQIFGAFGETFEMYAKDIFERMYPDPGSVLAKRFTYDLRGKDLNGKEIQLADACLNDVTELVLFEMKAIWVRDTVILDENHDRYLDHLRERYAIGQSEKDRPKGIAQLARTISNVVGGTWTPVGQEFGKVEKVYPVLLVHDSLLDTPVHASFLASEFSNALKPDKIFQDGTMRKGRFRVAPLTVMAIDLLESLETSIKYFRLMDLLRDYTTSSPDRIISLHNFIAASPEYRGKIYASKSVASKSLEVLKETMQRIFPT